MFPINRVVAFVLKPILTLAFGAAAAWLVKHFPGLDWDGKPGLDDEVTTAVEMAAQALAFAIGAFVTSRGIDKWLEGWIKHEENQTALELAGVEESPAGADNRELAEKPPGTSENLVRGQGIVTGSGPAMRDVPGRSPDVDR